MIKKTKYYICDKAYDCEWINDQRLVAEKSDSSEVCLGVMIPDENKIKIWDNGRDDDSFEWLLHEVIHAVSDELNLGLDENRVGLLGVGISGFLRRNGLIK